MPFVSGAKYSVDAELEGPWAAVVASRAASLLLDEQPSRAARQAPASAAIHQGAPRRFGLVVRCTSVLPFLMHGQNQQFPGFAAPVGLTTGLFTSGQNKSRGCPGRKRTQ